MRSTICEQLACGSAGLAEVMDLRRDPRVGEVHLLTVLESLPGATKVATRRKLEELGIPERTRLSELADHEVSTVIGSFVGSGTSAGEDPR